MKYNNKVREQLFLLLWDNLFNFLSGSLAAYILIEIANQISYQLPKILLQFFGYTIYYYWVTPFLVYWLGYVSADKLTKTKFLLTVCLVSTYSYVVWDSYFFFKQTMTSLIVAMEQ